MTALNTLFTLIDHEYTWTDGIKLNALRQAARDLCRITGAWRVTLAPVSLVEAQRDYALPVPDGAEVCRVTQLWHEGRALTPVNRDDLNAYAPDWATHTHAEPSYFYMPETGVVAVYPLPDGDATGALVAEAVLRPTLAATDIPDHLAYYEDILRHGALAWLFSLAAKPWFNPDAAGYHQKLFAGKVNDLTAQLQGLQINRPRRVKGRPFGGSRASRSLI